MSAFDDVIIHDVTCAWSVIGYVSPKKQWASVEQYGVPRPYKYPSYIFTNPLIWFISVIIPQ